MGIGSTIRSALNQCQCKTLKIDLLRQGCEASVKSAGDKTVISSGKGDDVIHLRYNADGSGTAWVNGERHELSVDQMKDLTIDAGSGDDRVVVSGTPDLNANLTIIGGNGDDVIYGGSGGETIDGGGGHDQIFGMGGNDTLMGGGGNDQLNGGVGDDSIFGNKGGDTIDGGAGNDSIDGGKSGDRIYGGDGDDSIYGGGGNHRDVIFGGNGNDSLSGGRGSDIIRGGDGNDDIRGGSGSDYLFGGTGLDIINGSGSVASGGDYVDFGDQQSDHITVPTTSPPWVDIVEPIPVPAEPETSSAPTAASCD